MPKLNLKPSHKAIRDYYATLQQYEQHAIRHEGAVSNPFAFLLDTCTKQVNGTFIPQFAMHSPKGNRIVVDGVILDEYGLPFAYWEAKDMDDNLPKAVQSKRDKGYPLNNILFQTPHRAILYQNGQIALDLDITDPARLIAALQYLFAYVSPALDNWQTAVSDFRAHVPDLAHALKTRIEQRHETDPTFKEAFTDFYETCRTAINPDLSQDAVEEMLIQHILTERIFRTIFERSDFTSRNIIAVEIEKVSAALMRHAMSRDTFLKPLDRFYVAIEQAATLCQDFSQKQHFLNTFYEKFFQGFSEDVADTHGIVYTPQPIFANAGAALADLHVNYESCPKFEKLEKRETAGMLVDWRVEKMKLSKDKTQLKYNDFLTLDGIPAEVYDYRLGTRSALEWVVDQYRVKVDRRSGIKNDPNREAEPRYIVDLIGRVITVSLRTVEIVQTLPTL